MLNIVELYKTFSERFVPVLKNINFQLSPKEFCILIGSNGSGKSSLLKIISGEYKNETGNIFLAEQNITKLSMHARSKIISSVSQDITKGIIQEMTLFENLVLSQFRVRNAKLKFYSEYKTKLIFELKKLGLEQYIDQTMTALSGGQKQMVAILMAFLSTPQVLLLDEPTSALDPKIQKQLMEYMVNTIVNNNITTIMVTHNLEDAIRYGNRLIMLHEGQIVLDLKGEQKNSLTTEKLLNLFHNYEDFMLRGH